jgi:glutamate racemase
VYFGDTGRFPYGPKPPEELLAYSLQIADLLCERGARVIVVACNSAAAAALDTLHEELTVPVLGVVEPGVRAAVRASRSGRIGVIGTVGTIASGAYERVTRHIDESVTLTSAACPGFVEFVEAGNVESPEVRALAERLLAPVREAEVDTLVLGCTHYPLLTRTIGAVMGPEVLLVSSADETALAVRDLLHASSASPAPSLTHESPPRHSSPPTHSKQPLHSFLTSGDVDTFRRLGARFLGPEVSDVEAWSW